MDIESAALAFHAAAYTIGAVLGFYVLLTRLKFPHKELPGLEGASWLLALFLFSQALWAYSKAALFFLGAASQFPSVPEIFWLVGQGAMTLFLLRLTSADPAHNRFGAALVLFMIVGLNALLIKYILVPEGAGSGAGLFNFAIIGFILAQLALVAAQLLKVGAGRARTLWASIAVGLVAQLLSMIFTGGMSEVCAVAAEVSLGMALPLQLVLLEKKKWPNLGKFASEEETGIAASAFLIVIYLLLFSVYFYSRSLALPGGRSLGDNVFFFISACWLYLMFAALVWYSHYRNESKTRDDKWKAQNLMLEKEVGGRTSELAKKVRELERFESVAVGREIRIAQLKKEIGKREGRP